MSALRLGRRCSVGNMEGNASGKSFLRERKSYLPGRWKDALSLVFRNGTRDASPKPRRSGAQRGMRENTSARGLSTCPLHFTRRRGTKHSAEFRRSSPEIPKFRRQETGGVRFARTTFKEPTRRKKSYKSLNFWSVSYLRRLHRGWHDFVLEIDAGLPEQTRDRLFLHP